MKTTQFLSYRKFLALIPLLIVEQFADGTPAFRHPVPAMVGVVGTMLGTVVAVSSLVASSSVSGLLVQLSKT